MSRRSHIRIEDLPDARGHDDHRVPKNKSPRLPVGTGVTVSNISVTLSQDEDCCGRAGAPGQDLIIETNDAGGGHYMVFITRRWALDHDELDTFKETCQAVLDLVDEPEPIAPRGHHDHGVPDSYDDRKDVPF